MFCHAIDEAYGNAEETKLNDFFEGMEGEIEIGDGVNRKMSVKKMLLSSSMFIR